MVCILQHSRMRLISAALLCMVYSRVDAILHPVCSTPECKQLGNYYRANMDINGKPCTDFYNYVCHNWPRHNPKPKNQALWDIEKMVERRTNEEVKKLLEDDRISSERVFEKAKIVYKMCMDLAHLGRLNATAIKIVMSRVPAWSLLQPTKKNLPVEQIWKIDNEYSKITGESALFSIMVLPLFRKADTFVTYLGVVQTPYGLLQRFFEWKKKTELPSYKLLLKRLIMTVASSASVFSENTLDMDLDRVIEFRLELEKIVQVPSVNDYREMTIGAFQEWYNHQMKKGTVQVNWLEFIRTFYQNHEDPLRKKISAKSTVFVEGMAKLVKVFENTPKRVIINHIHLYFLEKHLEIDMQTRMYLKESISDGANATGKILFESERWLKCISYHFMQTVLETMYLQNFFDAETEVAAKNLIDEARKSLSKQITESNWLDDYTKAISISKLNALGITIGSSKRNSDLSPLRADAYYILGQNHLYVSAGCLKWPLYTPNTTYVIDYGATVSIIGHELYHGFDLTGITYDANGNNNFWSSEMRKMYAQQSKCFYNQYLEYQNKQLKKHDLGQKGYSQNARDEDIADVMGLKLAYNRYRLKLKDNENVCPVLPGFEDFGCEKLFFIAFANTLCATATAGSKERILMFDEHSLYKVRVNGAVANMKEFSAAFGCTSNDPLRLEKTCDIWQK